MRDDLKKRLARLGRDDLLLEIARMEARWLAFEKKVKESDDINEEIARRWKLATKERDEYASILVENEWIGLNEGGRMCIGCNGGHPYDPDHAVHDDGCQMKIFCDRIRERLAASEAENKSKS